MASEDLSVRGIEEPEPPHVCELTTRYSTNHTDYDWILDKKYAGTIVQCTDCGTCWVIALYKITGLGAPSTYAEWRPVRWWNFWLRHRIRTGK